jgi:serine O-acetyltransferase
LLGFGVCEENVMHTVEQAIEFADSEYLWLVLRQEALAAVAREPVLAAFIDARILSHGAMAAALAYHLGRQLAGPDFKALAITEVCAQTFASDQAIINSFARDIQAVAERDPACRSYLQPFLFYKGLTALLAHRVAHWLWQQSHCASAFYLQSQVSTILQVDIHPAAVLGAGILLDHATGVVIGETSVVGDDVSILQSVTLGGNGKECGNRHPKIGRGVFISVGAKILGNISVGEQARVAAGSIVLSDVPAHATVAGAPAKVVRAHLAQSQAPATAIVSSSNVEISVQRESIRSF